jgi:hypothetical protein
MIGPAIMKFGTGAQKIEYLPNIWSRAMRCALDNDLGRALDHKKLNNVGD